MGLLIDMKKPNIVHIEAIKRVNEENTKLNEKEIAKLPAKIEMAYSIQFKEIAREIKKKIELKGIKVLGFYQVLGCTRIKNSNNKLNLAILLIGSGKFHALNIGLQRENVYIYSNGIIEKIKSEEVERLKQQKKAKIVGFLSSKRIGIIISTKPGQEKLKLAERLAERIRRKYKDKKTYLFISNNIDVNGLENFEIDFWINTACPRLQEDSSKVISVDEIQDFL